MIKPTTMPLNGARHQRGGAPERTITGAAQACEHSVVYKPCQLPTDVLNITPRNGALSHVAACLPDDNLALPACLPQT